MAKLINSNIGLISSMTEIHEKCRQISDGHIILWCFDRIEVLLTSMVPEALGKTEIKDIVRMRIFNTEIEYYIWRLNKDLRYRHRSDDDYPQKDRQSISMVLRGPISDQVKKIQPDLAAASSIGIETVQYIEYNEIGQAGYVDVRYRAFCKMNK